MTDENYKEIVKSLRSSVLDDTDYILRVDYDEKTQESSLLLDKLLGLNTYEEQAVYLAIIMSKVADMIREDAKEAISNI